MDRLPSLPQLLLRIVEAVHDESQGLPDLAAIIRHDTAISVRLLTAANSSFFNNRSQPCHTIERALLVLGLENVKTLVVTAALQQFVGDLARQQQAFLKVFWRRSLIAANFGQVLAGLTSYRNPAEAYLAGLLHQLGQLLLLNRHADRWLPLWQAATDAGDLAGQERQQFDTDHCERGAALVGQWAATGFLADAIRYSLEPGDAVRDAHHLVKITNLAASLAASLDSDVADDAACQRAHLLFGLGDALTQELCRRIASDVERLAESLQIDIHTDDGAADRTVRAALGVRLGELGQLNQLSAELARARSLGALEQAIRRTLAMTLDCRPVLLFAADAAGQKLTAALADASDRPAFEIPLLAGRSNVSDALLSGAPRTIDGDARAVVDRQLLGLEATPDLLCLPLSDEERPLGVLVIGRPRAAELAAQPPALSTPLLSTLCREVARALAQLAPPVGTEVAQSPARDWETDVREAIHEAGNPLSIVRNYLELLRARLDDPTARGEIDLIRDEIDRVGTILLRLRDSEAPAAGEPVAIDSVIDDVGRLFEQSLFAAHGVTLQRSGGVPDQLTAQPAELKQIVVNLLKNAVEAMPAGGRVAIATSGPVAQGSRHYLRLTVHDNGPGIPPELLGQLLQQPVTSTKGGAGVGLSVVRRLVDGMGGSIRCHSDGDGTLFELLLPWRAAREET